MNTCYNLPTDPKDPRPCEAMPCQHTNGLCAVCCGCDNEENK